MVCGFIVNADTSRVIFVTQVTLLGGMLEMIKEAVRFQELEIFDFSSLASSLNDQSENLS